jgi:hypothetical protein
LSIWLFDMKMPERIFWKEMNPARLCSLYSAYYRGKPRPKDAESLQKAEKPGFSLYSYLTGTGG